MEDKKYIVRLDVQMEHESTTYPASASGVSSVLVLLSLPSLVYTIFVCFLPMDLLMMGSSTFPINGLNT